MNRLLVTAGAGVALALLATCHGEPPGEAEEAWEAWVRALDEDRVSTYDAFVLDHPMSEYADGAALLARGIRRERRIRPDLIVSFHLPGWLAEDIAAEHGARIESAYGSLAGLLCRTTTIREGAVEVTLSLGYDACTAAHLDAVRAASRGLESSLEGSTDWVHGAWHQDAMVPSLVIAVQGEMSMVELSAKSRTLQAQLSASGLYTRVELSGASAPDVHWRITLNEGKLASIGCSPRSVANALDRMGGDVATSDELASLVILETDDFTVRLGDVALVRRTANLPTGRAFLSGAPAVLIRAWWQGADGALSPELESEFDAFAESAGVEVSAFPSEWTTVMEYALAPGSDFESRLRSAKAAAAICAGRERSPVCVEVRDDRAARLTALGPVEIRTAYNEIHGSLPDASIERVLGPLPETRGATLRLAVRGGEWSEVEAAVERLTAGFGSLGSVAINWRSQFRMKPGVTFEVDHRLLAALEIDASDLELEMAIRSPAGFLALGGRAELCMENTRGRIDEVLPKRIQRSGAVEILPVRRLEALVFADGERAAIVEVHAFETSQIASIRNELDALIESEATLQRSVRWITEQ